MYYSYSVSIAAAVPFLPFWQLHIFFVYKWNFLRYFKVYHDACCLIQMVPMSDSLDNAILHVNVGAEGLVIVDDLRSFDQETVTLKDNGQDHTVKIFFFLNPMSWVTFASVRYSTRNRCGRSQDTLSGLPNGGDQGEVTKLSIGFGLAWKAI